MYIYIYDFSMQQHNVSIIHHTSSNFHLPPWHPVGPAIPRLFVLAPPGRGLRRRTCPGRQDLVFGDQSTPWDGRSLRIKALV